MPSGLGELAVKGVAVAVETVDDYAALVEIDDPVFGDLCFGVIDQFGLVVARGDPWDRR